MIRSHIDTQTKSGEIFMVFINKKAIISRRIDVYELLTGVAGSRAELLEVKVVDVIHVFCAVRGLTHVSVNEGEIVGREASHKQQR